MGISIGIVGSRRRDGEHDFQAVLAAFESVYQPGATLVSGHCPRGADRFAERIAKEREIPIQLYPADWVQHGRAAGFIRNGLIAQDADILIACVAADRTGGTEDTIRKFQRLHPDGQLILV